MEDSLQPVTDMMLKVFESVKDGGLKMMAGAIGLGVIFIGGKWLWGKTRQWLSRV